MESKYVTQDALDMERTIDFVTVPHGVSGDEDIIRNTIINFVRDLEDEYTWEVDHLGNLICWRVCSHPTTIITAHMDEVGIMVIGHKDGKHKITSVGGLDPRNLPGSVWIDADNNRGVIGLPAPGS